MMLFALVLSSCLCLIVCNVHECTVNVRNRVDSEDNINRFMVRANNLCNEHYQDTCVIARLHDDDSTVQQCARGHWSYDLSENPYDICQHYYISSGRCREVPPGNPSMTVCCCYQGSFHDNPTPCNTDQLISEQGKGVNLLITPVCHKWFTDREGRDWPGKDYEFWSNREEYLYYRCSDSHPIKPHKFCIVNREHEDSPHFLQGCAWFWGKNWGGYGTERYDVCEQAGLQNGECGWFDTFVSPDKNTYYPRVRACCCNTDWCNTVEFFEKAEAAAIEKEKEIYENSMKELIEKESNPSGPVFMISEDEEEED